MEPTSPWKRPDEVMQLHRLRKRKRALQDRMKQPHAQNNDATATNTSAVNLDFSKILDGTKRRNPFSKNNQQDNKKSKSNDDTQVDQSNDKTLFALMNMSSKKIEKPIKNVNSDKLATFSNLLQKYTSDHAVEAIPNTKYKYLAVDWALKTKMRLMSPKPFAWSQHLKATEEASGITGFVRCLDTTSSSTLDTSPRALFHQTCLYWQHPHLPWITLFPRSSGKVAETSFIATNEDVKRALHRDWTESFTSLFQLLRARHCPYFYVCANTFTCLFRAAGLCGMTEPCAMITPTTRGLRQALRQEDVEFTMPLKNDSYKKLNGSDSKDDDRTKNTSSDSCYNTMDETKSQNGQQSTSKKDTADVSDDEDLESDDFLSEMGFGAEDIKKINCAQSRVQSAWERRVDSGRESLLQAEGAEAQALFNFLLNCRSLVSATGPLAGVPPTLLAPVAFHGATLNSLKMRESRVSVEGASYHSLEARGPLLPSAAQAQFRLLRAAPAPAPLSATFAPLATFAPSAAFSAATAAALSRRDSSKENEPNHFAKAFNKENLSDCGISGDLLQQLCSNDPKVIKSIDSVKYNPEDDTYTW